MAEIALSELLRLGIVQRVLGDASIGVRGIRHDSRRCEPGDLFVALESTRSDGAEYIDDAVRRGAVAILAERELTAEVPVLIAENALLALARAAQLLYDDPTRRLTVIGITGTNGKTTCAYLVEALLKASGALPAVLGTVNFRGPFGVLDASHTTPMADDLMRLARAAVDSGATHLVLEVSSHGLAMHRVDGVHFSVAAFTNLTQDHLDYHGDFASYEAAKRRLFKDLAPEVAVVNVEDPVGQSIASDFKRRVLRCAKHVGEGVDIGALSIASDRSGINAQVWTPSGVLDLVSPLIGEHNLENLLVAIGCGVALGLDNDDMLRALRETHGAPGRLERIEHPNDVLVFVDYAHTPDALERVMRTVRKATSGRLIVTFGCGGDRDPGKRPLMGESSAQLADLVVLTSDNPRTEAQLQILQQIEVGVRRAGMPALTADAFGSSARGYVVESNRHLAIRLALLAAQPGDTVLIAGKGHEKVQIVGDQRFEFDDCVEARAVIATLSPATEGS
jgi:UDP-N-acetylmuramoyl-L-alanyl-D-glutamate--2,6-diaminopimelate ligase